MRQVGRKRAVMMEAVPIAPVEVIQPELFK